MNAIYKLSIFAFSLILLSFVGTSTMAVGQPATDQGAVQQNQAGNTNQSGQATQTQNQSEDKQLQAKTKLEQTKLKICQKREQNINNIMSRIADRGQKQLNLFTSIAEKTQKFYEDKNLNVANYQELLDDISAKKTTAQEALQNMNQNKAQFKCDGTDPKGAVNGFQESLKKEIEVLKDYKTAVRNFIVAVKTAAESVNTEGTN
jgi:hypothetical protein